MRSGGRTGPIPLTGVCDYSILKNPPGNRLQLLVWYTVRLPGTYSVRWISEEYPSRDGEPAVKYIRSAWSTFTVSPISSQEREHWLTHFVPGLPTNRNTLMSNFVPSLIACAPDERALNAAIGLLYSRDGYIVTEAQEALLYFPREQVRAAITDSVRRRGTNDVILRMTKIGLFGLDSKSISNNSA